MKLFVQREFASTYRNDACSSLFTAKWTKFNFLFSFGCVLSHSIDFHKPNFYFLNNSRLLIYFVENIGLKPSNYVVIIREIERHTHILMHTQKIWIEKRTYSWRFVFTLLCMVHTFCSTKCNSFLHILLFVRFYYLRFSFIVLSTGTTVMSAHRIKTNISLNFRKILIFYHTK